MQSTDRELQPVADRMSRTTRTVTEATADNGRLQTSYNHIFGSCMAARGNVVPAWALAPDPDPTTTAMTDPVLAAGSRGMTSAATGPANLDEAVDAIAAPFKSSCDDGPIAVAVHNAPISQSRTARRVSLSQPGGGNCFGQPGSNEYLLANSEKMGWTKLLAAEPGSLRVLATTHAGYQDIALNSLGSCVFTLRWTGLAYQKVAAHDCPFDAPPGLGDVTREIRRR